MMNNKMIVDRSKDQKIREAVEKSWDSEVLRSAIILFFMKPDILTKKGQSIASMGVKRLLQNGFDIEEFKSDSLHSKRTQEAE
jgi:hypothetical protein